MKKSNLIYLYLIPVLAFFLLTSCEKDELETLPKSAQTIQVAESYFIDDVPSTQAELAADTSLLLVTICKDGATGTSSQVIEHRAYSTEEKYLQFGDNNGYKFSELNEDAKKMREFAEKSGAIDSYNKTGILPSSYTDFEKTISKNSDKLRGTPGYCEYALDYNRTNIGFASSASFPIMPIGFNNNISYINFVGGSICVLKIFDNIFYTGLIETIIWNSSYHIEEERAKNLTTSNNRMSSVQFGFAF